MRTEIRFLLAIGLMFVVLIGTNLLFPPVVPDPTTEVGLADSLVARRGGPGGPGRSGAHGRYSGRGARADAQRRSDASAEAAVDSAAGPSRAEQLVAVEGPLFRYEFSTLGARMLSARAVRGSRR